MITIPSKKEKKTKSKHLIITYDPEPLKKLCQIAVCKELWTQRPIRRYITEQYGHTRPNNLYAQQVLLKIFKRIDTFYLEPGEKDDLAEQAEKMGYAISKWLVYLKETFGIDDIAKYLNSLKWTAFGSIDEPETIRSLYRRTYLPANETTWKLINRYCLEDCITHHLNSIPNILRTRIPYLRSTATDILHCYMYGKVNNRPVNSISHMAINYCSIARKRMRSNARLFDDKVDTVPIHIINVHHQTIPYFWPSLTYDQKISLIINFISMNVVKEYYELDTATVAFILRQALSFPDQFDGLSIMTSEIFLRKLRYWPFDQILLNSLHKYWKYLQTPHFNAIVMYFKNVDWHLRAVVFEEAWDMLQPQYKNSIILNDYFIDKHVTNVHIMDCVVNDPVIATQRMELIRTIAAYLVKRAYKYSNFQGFVVEFSEQVLRTPREREMFKELCLSHHKSK